MKRTAFSLLLLGALGTAQADTIFDAIHSDAAQTTYRWYMNDKDNSNGPAFSYFNNKFFSGDKFDAGFFTTGASATPLDGNPWSRRRHVAPPAKARLVSKAHPASQNRRFSL